MKKKSSMLAHNFCAMLHRQWAGIWASRTEPLAAKLKQHHEKAAAIADSRDHERYRKHIMRTGIQFLDSHPVHNWFRQSQLEAA